MKKTVLQSALILAVAVLSLSLAAQINYSGMTGNLVAGDFDSDGFIDDIAAFNTADAIPTLTLWTSTHGLMEENQANIRLTFDFISPRSLNAKIVSGDFDNDGFKDDLASIYEIGLNKTSVTVWINQDGAFIPGQWWYGADFDANQTYQTLVSGDFDNDGFEDDIAAFYNYEMKRTKVYMWLSNGTKFNWPGTWWIGNDFDASRIQGTLVAGDFDHDGFNDDVTALYDYPDGYCKAFVWLSSKNKFNWPYTWFAQADVNIGKAKGNVVSGDFNGNGFVDDVAAIYPNDEQTSSVWVFNRGRIGFNAPETWWFGASEAFLTQSRLVVADWNNNSRADQFTGLLIDGTTATLTTWTSENNTFTLPETSWQGIALSTEDCDKNGGCINSDLANGLELYPNPSNGNFWVKIPECNQPNVHVSVINYLGQTVKTWYESSGKEVAVDLQQLTPGSYFIQINGDGLQARQSFMVQ
jgi:hypothetical protein